MSDEFEVRHFDNRVQPGNDLEDTPRRSTVISDDESLEIGRTTKSGQNTAQNTPSKKHMATYHQDYSDSPPAPAQYQRHQYGNEGGDNYEVQVIGQQRPPPAPARIQPGNLVMFILKSSKMLPLVKDL